MVGVTQEKLMEEAPSWRALLDQSEAAITRIVQDARRIAVIGIKRSAVDGPSFGVPAYMQRAGYDIVPVPVYYPDTTEILGVPVHRSLATIDPPADLVLVFRRSPDVAKHIDEILAANPRVVWMQVGIRHDAAAEQFARAGIAVIQNKCFMVELRKRGR